LNAVSLATVVDTLSAFTLAVLIGIVTAWVCAWGYSYTGNAMNASYKAVKKGRKGLDGGVEDAREVEKGCI